MTLQPNYDDIRLMAKGDLVLSELTFPEPVNITKQVRITGVSEDHSVILDFQGRVNVMKVLPEGSLTLVQLTTLNHPEGPKHTFPWSTFVGSIYAIER